jgi:serine/threonine protein kinase
MSKFIYSSGDRPLDGYIIKRGIGQGGFGEVYYAVSEAGKEVALKLVRGNEDVELRGMQQCINLKHPNLVSLYDIKTDAKGDSWVIMEYVAVCPSIKCKASSAISARRWKRCTKAASFTAT